MAESSRKRRRVDPTEICQQIYDVVRNYKKEDGSLLCDSFIRAPKRRQEPAYFEVVSNPIDLLRIQQKIRTDEYEDVEQMTVDFKLLVNNGKLFYPPDSPGYEDACTIWQVYQQTFDKVVEETDDSCAEAKPTKGVVAKAGGRLSKKVPVSAADSDAGADSEESRDAFNTTSSTEEDNQFEELFSAVMKATSSDGRVLHPVFQLLPSRKAYPDYYQVIEQPVDLKTIAAKIQANEYGNLNEMERDLNQMVKNACTYNEPGSQIYKDAKALKKVFTARKSEIEHAGKQSGGGKTSERIR